MKKIALKQCRKVVKPLNLFKEIVLKHPLKYTLKSLLKNNNATFISNKVFVNDKVLLKCGYYANRLSFYCRYGSC